MKGIKDVCVSVCLTVCLSFCLCYLLSVCYTRLCSITVWLCLANAWFLLQTGKCWLQLNLYPVEKSLKQLAHKFSNLSINRENITIFITMLQGLRFMLGNEELVTILSFAVYWKI